MIEEWKHIDEYPSYEVSTLGRIRGARGIRKPYMTKQGYLTILLNQDGKKYNRFVHCLVLMAFVGPKPDGLEVCHGDNIKTNNCLSNLRYDTRSSNRLDSLK